MTKLQTPLPPLTTPTYFVFLSLFLGGAEVRSSLRTHQTQQRLSKCLLHLFLGASLLPRLLWPRLPWWGHMVEPTPYAHKNAFIWRLMLSMMSWSSAVCPGGVSTPCSHRGKCDDGHLGNGTCACDTGFSGVACELCSPGFYGVTCKGELVNL